MKYKVHEDHKDGNYIIEFTEGQFKSILFTIGEVKFDEGKDGAILAFHYDIIKGDLSESDKEIFQTEVGDLLIKLIEDGLKNQDLIYTGGKDEGREVSYREVDSE